MCHHNSFLLYGAMVEQGEAAWARATHCSLAISATIVTVLAIAGYSTFTGFTQGDLLENYCGQDGLVSAARAAFCLVTLLTFPIECFVCREVLINLLPVKQRTRLVWHAGTTLALVVTAAAASLVTDCLGVVLELNGILVAVPLAFVLPAICCLRLCPEEKFKYNDYTQTRTGLRILTSKIAKSKYRIVL